MGVFTLTGKDLSSGLKGKLKAFSIDPMPIEAKFEWPSDKKFDPLLQQKFTEAANAKIDEIIGIFTEEILKIDSKVAAALAKDPKSVNLADEQNTANTIGKQIAASMNGHVQAACDKVLEELKKAHKELVKYKVKCALKITWSVIKISVAAARLGASHGGDVHAWFTVAKEFYAIAVVVYEICKTVDTVLNEAYQAYEALEKVVIKEKKDTNPVTKMIRQVGQVEPKCKKVEEKLKAISPKIIALDEKSHGLAIDIEKMLALAEKVEAEVDPKSKEKVKKIETKIHTTIEKVHNNQAKINEVKNYIVAVKLSLVDIRKDFTKASAKTTKVLDFLQKAKEMYDQAKEVIDVMKDIADLAS